MAIGPGGRGTTGFTQQRWDDFANPWPPPSNFCEFHPGGCDADGSVITGSFRYSAATHALATDHEEVAAIVAILQTAIDGQESKDEVVVVTSLDGGQTFTNARIISNAPATDGARASFIPPARVDATTIVTSETASERRQDSTAAHLIVWQGNPTNQELGQGPLDPAWFMQKVQVDPSNGDVAILWDTVTLQFPENTGFVTVRAWEDSESLENMAFMWSARSERDGTPFGPFDELPGCPSDETIRVEWFWRKAIGVFDHVGTVSPNYVEPKLLVDTDEAWRPCLGPSHVDPSTLTPPIDPSLAHYRNSDRMDMAVNRHPRLQRLVYGRSNEIGLNRVFTLTRDLDDYIPFPSPPDFFKEELPAPEGAEDYTPRITMSQGVVIPSLASPYPDSPQSSIIRRRIEQPVAGVPVDIVARTTVWRIEDVPGGGFEIPFGGVIVDANVTLGGGTAPARREALTLGLSYKPMCVDDSYGPCTLGVLDRRFHAAYPESSAPSGGKVFGQSYAH